MRAPRTAQFARQTKETNIQVRIDLDGQGRYDVKTGIGFFDHMLEQLAKHSLINIDLKASGDLHIDAHHTVEDTGIALGTALRQALGERRAISRYGAAHIPMDECLTEATVDISGRPFLVFHIDFKSPKIGDFDTELFEEFFRAFAFAAGITLHITNRYGENSHHKIESAFKATARALRAAIAYDPRLNDEIASTKGQLSEKI